MPWLLRCAATAAAAPTDGWRQTSFTYGWQKPWNLDLGDRHSYSGGVHRMWVYATDEPFEEGSSTDPRTEMRWKVDDSLVLRPASATSVTGRGDRTARRAGSHDRSSRISSALRTASSFQRRCASSFARCPAMSWFWMRTSMGCTVRT